MASPYVTSKMQVLDNNIDALAGGKVYTYEAGTSTPKVTYQEQAGITPNTNPVILDSNGRPEYGIWLSGAYKMIIKDSDDNTIYTEDDIISYTDVDFTGLTATIADLNSTTTTAVNITNNYDILTTDRGKNILADATSTNIAVNLLAAATATNRYKITIKKVDDSTNTVTINPDGTETVDYQDTYILYDLDDFVEVLCDGSNWRIVSAQIRGTLVTLTSTTDIELEDCYKTFLCNSSGGAFNANLPPAAEVGRGYYVTFKKTDSSVNAITIVPDGVETIDGASSLPIREENNGYVLKTDGSNWFVIYGFAGDITEVITGAATSGDGQNYTATIASTITEYVDGHIFSIRFNDAQTVASPTLDINSIGAKAIKSLQEVALEANVLFTNRHYLLAYSLAYDDFHLLTPTEATSAQMRDDSDRTVVVVPRRMRSSPVAAKAWVNFKGTGTLAVRDSYLVSSVSDLGTGNYKINFNFTWANDDFVACGIADGTTAERNQIGNYAFTTTTHHIKTTNYDDDYEDAEYVTLSYFGENTE